MANMGTLFVKKQYLDHRRWCSSENIRNQSW